MRFKSAYKYQLFELKKAVIVYYIIIVALMILTAVTLKLLARHVSISMMGGFDAATVIFLFVCGLNAFKQPFHMFMANGISRRTLFVSTVAAFGTVAAGMALIDGILNLVMSSFFLYGSTFAQSFGEWYGIADGVGLITLPTALNGFVWAMLCYMAAAMAGLFITTAYYRMSKPLKLAVSIGVPVLVFIVLPIIDASLFHGVVTAAVSNFFYWATSLLGKGNPYSIVLFNVFSILISGGLVWLLMRRATVKSI